jgi:hypothetical protein
LSDASSQLKTEQKTGARKTGPKRDIISFAFTRIINWTGLALKPGDWNGIGNLSSSLPDVSNGLGLPILAAIAVISTIIATAECGDWEI